MSAIAGGSLGFSPLRPSLRERYGLAPASPDAKPATVKHYGLSDDSSTLAPTSATIMLDLRARQISRSELLSVAAKLPQCTKLESVNLEWNSLGQQPEALSTFLVAITESTSVKSLDLRNTSLGRDCASAIGNLLTRNRSIQHLDLRWNNLSPQAEQYILSGLQNNPTIRSIELAGNELSPECLAAAEKICRRNRDSVQKFNLPPYDPDAESKLRMTQKELQETAQAAAQSRQTATQLKGSLLSADNRIGQLQASNSAYELSLSKLTRELGCMRREVDQTREAAAAREDALKEALEHAHSEAQRHSQAKEDAELAAQRMEHTLRRDMASLQHQVRAVEADCKEAQLALNASQAETQEERQRANDALKSKADLEGRLRAEMESARKAAAKRAEDAQEMHERHLAQLREALAQETDRVVALQAQTDDLQQQLDAAAKAKATAVANEHRRVSLEWQRKLEAETSQLRAELSDACAETKLAQESLRSASEMHEAERERLQASASTYQQRAQAADREAEELRGEAAALQAQMQSMQREEASLRSSVKRLHAIKEELSAECVKLRQKVADAEADKQAALLRQRKQLEQYLSDREARIVALKQEIMGNKARMDKLLSDTGRQMQSLYAANIASFKRQVLEYDRLVVPNLEQSGAAFPPMSPDVMGALMSDDVQRTEKRGHPSAEEIAEEQWMYSNAFHEAEQEQQQQQHGLPPPHEGGATTARPTLWTETPTRVRVGGTTSSYTQGLPQGSPASTSSFASPGTESQGRTPAHPALHKQSSNQPLMTLQMLQQDTTAQPASTGSRLASNIRLSLSGSAQSEEDGGEDESYQQDGSWEGEERSASPPQDTSPVSDEESLDIEDEEV